MIHIVNVSKQYPMRQGFATVLDGVNLTIRPNPPNLSNIICKPNVDGV